MKKTLLIAVAVASLAVGAADVRLMSFNVLHGTGVDKKVDLVRTASVINKEKPDFAGLQEVDRMGRRSGEVDQPEVLASLTGMHATFAKAIPLPENGEYGVMVLSRKKPLSVLRTPLPGREPRVLLLCEFDDCWFGTTHLPLQESNRVAAVQIIQKAVSERAATKPVFLTGDWNARPTSKTLADIRRFMTVLSDESTRTFHGFKWHEMKEGEHCIDYIAVTSADAKRVVVRESHVVPDVTTSDHSPVVATVAPAAPPFVVASFNMRTDCGEKADRAWSNRCPRVVKIIRDHKFDVIGAQELKHNQVADLKRALGPEGYEIVGRGRLEGGKSEGVYLIYNAHRFECVTNDTFQLSETPEIWGSSSWGSAYPRTCVWAQLTDRKGLGGFRFYNTHLDHVSELARKKGMELILGRIKADVAAGTTAFLTGDFNNELKPGNAVDLARQAMKDTADLSLSPHLGPVNTYHGYTPPARTLIDYVFVRGPVRVLSHVTHDDMPDDKVPTDHYPVSAMVSLPVSL